MSSALIESSPVFIAPVEILREIFSHCDQPTLAAVSRVSFGCLELTSRFLYEDVVVRRLRSVALLFRLKSPTCVPPVPQSDRVSVHTSLSLIQTITLELDSSRMDSGRIWWDNTECERMDDHVCSFHDGDPDPPLAIKALTISLPDTPRSSFTDLNYLSFLVNPEVLVARLRSSVEEGLSPSVAAIASPPEIEIWTENPPTWSRLRLVLVQAVCIRAIEFLVQVDAKLCVVYDCAHLTEDQVRRASLNDPEDDSFSGFATWQDHVFSNTDFRAWVFTAEAQALLTTKVKDKRDHGWLVSDQTWSVQVASEKILRFRRELAIGVHKGMDWAALDEM